MELNVSLPFKTLFGIVFLMQYVSTGIVCSSVVSKRIKISCILKMMDEFAQLELL